MAKIGVLHPGNMGVSLAVSAKTTGNEVYWASEGRSEETRGRAEKHGLIELESVRAICEQSEGIICICPPHGAEHVAREVAEYGFSGLYLDANAISPTRARTIAGIISGAGAQYVDGGVIGGPAWKPNSTYLHLSGANAEAVADWFRDGLVVTNLLGSDVSKASAVKMCFSAYTKGTLALFYGSLAASDALGVREALIEQWSRYSGMADLAKKAEGGADGMTAKAWRWIDEMEQISQTFESAGLPGGFHAAAAEVYRRSSSLREVEDPSIEMVLQKLLGRD